MFTSLALSQGAAMPLGSWLADKWDGPRQLLLVVLLSLSLWLLLVLLSSGSGGSSSSSRSWLWFIVMVMVLDIDIDIDIIVVIIIIIIVIIVVTIIISIIIELTTTCVLHCNMFDPRCNMHYLVNYSTSTSLTAPNHKHTISHFNANRALPCCGSGRCHSVV